MSYDARSRLYFSFTTTAALGTYDLNWHWYDGTGMRVLSEVRPINSFPTFTTVPGPGPRSYYIYDGNDVALVVVRSGSSWFVRQRFLTGGVDDVIAGRYNYTTGGGIHNLALVNDRQGTTLAAMKSDGTQEAQTWFMSRNPYGMSDQLSFPGGSLVNLETGFTGASTPNPTSGFVYLRNRWYDPSTGRFLTQDPIGLAGGVNVYSYAGNNPVMFTDPFGLFDVEYTDDQTKKEVTEMRTKSKTFDNAMRDLENNHGILVKIGQGSTIPCGGSGGCAQQEGRNKKGQSVYSVTWDPGGVQSENALLQFTAHTTANVQTTLGHEVYGHVVPWTNGFDCPDGPPGTPAAQSCSVRRENVIRRELRIPIRTQY